MVIKTTDVWTEQRANHTECFDGAFIDGIENGSVPYDTFKIVLNCNCEISANSDDVVIGNKHNAIVFYKNGKVVRLAVLSNETDVSSCLKSALSQKIGNVSLEEFLQSKGVTQEISDMQEEPIFNEHNGKQEMDAGSCDRLPLLNCMLRGEYTESETSLGNYDCNEFDYVPEIEVTYRLTTDQESFDIKHSGAFINKTRTKIIIIQEDGSISKKDIEIEK